MRKINFYPKDDYDNDYDEDYDGTLDDYDPAESEMSMSAEDAMNENEDDDLEEMLEEMDGKTSAATAHSCSMKLMTSAGVSGEQTPWRILHSTSLTLSAEIRNGRNMDASAHAGTWNFLSSAS